MGQGQEKKHPIAAFLLCSKEEKEERLPNPTANIPIDVVELSRILGLSFKSCYVNVIPSLDLSTV